MESRDWSDDLMAVFYLSLLIIVAAGSTGSAGINNESVFAQMCPNGLSEVGFVVSPVRYKGQVLDNCRTRHLRSRRSKVTVE